jgi:hypothetical protein
MYGIFVCSQHTAGRVWRIRQHVPSSSLVLISSQQTLPSGNKEVLAGT